MAAFKGMLEQWADERRAKYMAHVRPPYRELFERGQPISMSAWGDLHEEYGMNLWERHLLLPLADDRVLVYLIENAQANAQWRERGEYSDPAITYDEALITTYLPLLLKRFCERNPGASISKEV
jgi:hypothetical protein